MAHDADDGDVVRLNALLSKWREPKMQRVLPRLVIPDATNRANSGVSLEHAHGIAMSICEDGFNENHDVPVVVRERARDMLKSDAYRRWEAFSRANARVLPEVSARTWASRRRAYATLGSSHLNLALKLIEYDVPSVFERRWERSRRIRYGDALTRDAGLREAIVNGLPSVVLRSETPPEARREISLMLNRAEDVGFRINERGEAVRVRDGGDEIKELTVFEALSRTLDSEELSSLARIKYGLDLDDAEAGYVADAAANTASLRSRL